MPLDGDDDLAQLMPNISKLIRSGESNSLESKGSTSMNFSPDNVKENIVNPKRRGQSIFREVANRFLQRGAAGKRVAHSSALATLSSNRRNATALDKENVKPKVPVQGARATLQQNVAMRNASQKLAGKIRNEPLRAEGSSYFSGNSKIQKTDKSNALTLSENHVEPAATKASAASRNGQGSKLFGKSAGKSARSKLETYKTTVPIDLSELKKDFAQLDEEALEEEEIPIARRNRRSSLVATSKTLYLAKNIQQNSVEKRKKLSKSEEEKVVSNTVNEKIKEATLPICSLEHGQGVSICMISSEAPPQGQNVQVSQQRGEEKDARLSSGHDRNTTSCSVRKLSPDDPRGSPPRDLDDADVNHADNVDFQNVETSPLIEQHSPSLLSKVLDNQASGAINARTADATASPCQLEACVLEMSGKGTNVCAQIELANADGSCNTKRGCTPTNPNVNNLKESAADGPYENAGHAENSMLRHSAAFRVVRRSSSKAKHILKQEDIPDNSQRGTLSPDKSATAPRLHHTRRGRIKGINQRRLTFDSCSDSKQKATARDVGSDSTDASVSIVQVQGKSNSYADIINHDGLELPANMTSAPNQEAITVMADDQGVAMADDKGVVMADDKGVVMADDKGVVMADDQGVVMADDKGVVMADDQGVVMADDQGVVMADDEDVDQLVDRDCTSDCLKLQAATHTQGVVSKEKALTGSPAQGGNQAALETSRGKRKDPYCFNSPSTHAGRTTKCLKLRGMGKRTWANLGAPIDGGREWKEGRRVSTRIKSRPLDWWRGERMLYGRVHSTLCTLIGIKTTTPDPVWPGPKPQRGDYTTRKFHVDSFVDESHCELLRLAAQ